MQKIVIIVVIIIAFSVGLSPFLFREMKTDPSTIVQENVPSNETETVAVDHRAAFAIFTNGTFRVFTASMYHNLSKDIFIESSNPNIVVIKKSGITWDDFFSTLPFSLTHECLVTGNNEVFCNNENNTLRFFLNGQEQKDLLEMTIQDGDQLLVTYGNESDEEIQKQQNSIPDL